MASSDQGPKTEAGGGGESSETVAASDEMLLYRGFKKAKKERGCTAKERISKMPPCTAGKRSSIYRGVTRYFLLICLQILNWRFRSDFEFGIV